MDKYERFEAWLRENGARFDQLELREYDCPVVEKKVGVVVEKGEGEEKKETTTQCGDDDDLDENRSTVLLESEMRGVHARSHIPPNTICMSIPRRCLITVEMGQATPIGQIIYHADLDLDAPKHIYLMIYILWDRKVHGPHSFFAPYYDILPKTLNNMPIFWTPQELAHLQGSYLLQQIADRNQAITEDYHLIASVAPALRQICTLEEFKWARMCVCSRNFGLQIDGHRTSALVPHADMLNHYRPRETKWTFDEERNAFTITSLQHIPAGAQVYDSYGQKCNHRFLLNYGFAVEDNREMDGFCPNEVPLDLYVDPMDENYVPKLEFWLRGEIHSNHLSLTSQQFSLQNGIHSIHNVSPSDLQQQQMLTATEKNNLCNNNLYDYNNSFRQSMPHYVTQPQVTSSIKHFHSLGTVESSSSLNHTNNAAVLVKRVRICVSNNENTRLLFSLLRTLALNEAELRVIANYSPTTGLTADSVVSRVAMFGFSDSSSSALRNNPLQTSPPPPPPPPPPSPYQTTQKAHTFITKSGSTPSTVLSSSSNAHFVLTGTPTPTASYRSCRDIRHPISLRNETAALKLLLDLCVRQLAQYPTTMAQDVADLANFSAFPRFSNVRHAKIQVRGEKEVLHHYILWARTALEVIDVIQEELLEERNNSSSGGGSVEVKLTETPSLSTTTLLSGSCTKFEAVIRQMEEQQHHHHHPPPDGSSGGDSSFCDDGISSTGSSSSMSNGIHHTILRYCSDVLGSLRREEMKNLGRLRSAGPSPLMVSSYRLGERPSSSGYI